MKILKIVMFGGGDMDMDGLSITEFSPRSSTTFFWKDGTISGGTPLS